MNFDGILNSQYCISRHFLLRGRDPQVRRAAGLAPPRRLAPQQLAGELGVQRIATPGALDAEDGRRAVLLVGVVGVGLVLEKELHAAGVAVRGGEEERRGGGEHAD